MATKRLRTRLFRLNYSLVVLASMLGLSVSYLYRVRQDSRGINGKFIVSALTAFPKCRFEDLFYIEEV